MRLHCVFMLPLPGAPDGSWVLPAALIAIGIMLVRNGSATEVVRPSCIISLYRFLSRWRTVMSLQHRFSDPVGAVPETLLSRECSQQTRIPFAISTPKGDQARPRNRRRSSRNDQCEWTKDGKDDASTARARCHARCRSKPSRVRDVTQR